MWNEEQLLHTNVFFIKFSSEFLDSSETAKQKYGKIFAFIFITCNLQIGTTLQNNSDKGIHSCLVHFLPLEMESELCWNIRLLWQLLLASSKLKWWSEDKNRKTTKKKPQKCSHNSKNVYVLGVCCKVRQVSNKRWTTVKLQLF